MVNYRLPSVIAAPTRAQSGVACASSGPRTRLPFEGALAISNRRAREASATASPRSRVGTSKKSACEKIPSDSQLLEAGLPIPERSRHQTFVNERQSCSRALQVPPHATQNTTGAVALSPSQVSAGSAPQGEISGRANEPAIPPSIEVINCGTRSKAAS